MTLFFVSHHTPEPALYGAMAAILAERLRWPLAHLPAVWDLSRYPDACQHVTAAGSLVTSGLLWFDRLGRGDATRLQHWRELSALPIGTSWVVPLAPAQMADFHHWRRSAAAHGVEFHWVEVDAAGDDWVFNRAGVTETAWGRWRPDRFGRLTAGDDRAPAGTALRIALIGARSDQRDAYPATLAALGDAADGLSLPLDVRFIAPQSPLPPADALQGVDGVLLPGGSAMANVAGQIAVARYTLAHAIPTLGLCLGMQTMTTAVAQAMLGSDRVNLAEADPDAPIPSFVPLAVNGGHPVHRLGEQTMLTRPSSRLAGLLGPRFTVRYNHRFELNPALKPPLTDYGLAISATDTGGTIADGIELRDHAFYLGVQGHPELSSRRRRPHPLLTAFLRAAAGR